MLEPIHHTTATFPLPNPINRSPLWRGLVFIPLAFACFGFLPAARAVSPPPDGGYSNFNTAEGDGALFSHQWRRQHSHRLCYAQ